MSWWAVGESQGIRLVHYLDDFLFAVAGDATGEHSLFKSVQQRVLSDIQAAGFLPVYSEIGS